MYILRLIKFLVYTFGGLTGLVLLGISYVLQLPAPTSPDIKDLHPQQQEWYKKGSMIEILGKKMFTVTKGNSENTLILIHGFPTSSFDYFEIIDNLSEDYRVVAFDHIGFGFSDKPSNYTYSLVDQAEQALALWRHLAISEAHIVSHDMGDSVLTEILSRHQRGMLPDYFNNFFKSITFTNGGMVYDLINKRASQKILNSPVGRYINQITCRLDKTSLGRKFGGAQLGSVWSPSYGNHEKKLHDIQNIEMLNKYKNGNCMMYKTISYLSDRARFEPRWLESLSQLKLPIQLLWGDADAVSPMDIPQTLAKLINPDFLTFTVFPNTGHFLALERPELLIDRIKNFISRH